jgi:hypothetical protein
MSSSLAISVDVSDVVELVVVLLGGGNSSEVNAARRAAAAGDGGDVDASRPSGLGVRSFSLSFGCRSLFFHDFKRR